VGPNLASAAGGAAAGGTMLHVDPTGVTVQCKLGDEVTLANSLAAVLTGANVTNVVPTGQLFGAVN
jgi:hypothetical protein